MDTARISLLRFFLLLPGIWSMLSCRVSRSYKTTVDKENAYHHSYDDTTLTINNSSVLMPYNRIIDPAGTVIRYGNPAIENHSLDCVLLPAENILVAEDRFGIAFLDVQNNKLLFHLNYEGAYKGYVSTYSGVKVWKIDNMFHVFWGAASPDKSKRSALLEAVWNGKDAKIINAIFFDGKSPAPMALPNDMAIHTEDGTDYLYVVLNGNDELIKMSLEDKRIIWTANTGRAPFGLALTGTMAFVSNWAGSRPTDSARETAGIPYGTVYVDSRTGATSSGTITVIDLKTGAVQTEIEGGLHPNVIIPSSDQRFVYVANANSDDVTVISTATNKVVETISVKLNTEETALAGDSPNGLAIDSTGKILYVSNGMDNAICVVKLGKKSSAIGEGDASVSGFIPTEAYPAGVKLYGQYLYVCNLEGEGARIENPKGFTIHQQQATISVIALPEAALLNTYTARVKEANLLFRAKLSALAPRKDQPARPVPQRIGEPSVFKHVIYIIKENKTFDQVMGDLPQGNGMESLCIYGNNVTPNEHKIVKDYLLLDNYYASGKSSAEGHSWTDAAIVSDYVEKNVGAWFRSYPHVLADALVYNKQGFIWNNALDHGKTVRIYGEACEPRLNEQLTWSDIYKLYTERKPLEFTNTTTISRVRPVMSPSYPCYEGVHINDQFRADAFIKELHEFEQLPGDRLPELIVMALPADHTAGMREGFPIPSAMVADNDLALGRIIEALTNSRFWDSTVVFITEDDTQGGWDHVSPYRTVGMVVSPYSCLQKTVHTNYNQTCMVRTMEQILGIPPMNVIDATALPMFDCFNENFNRKTYNHLTNNIRLDEMNRSATILKGKAKEYAMLSNQFSHVDEGNDDLLNRILWFDAMGERTYPKKKYLSKKEKEEGEEDIPTRNR